MKKHCIIVYMAVFCLLVVTAPAFAGGNKKRLEEENAQLSEELATTRSRISELEMMEKNLKGKIDMKDSELEALSLEAEDLKQQIEYKNRELETLYADSETLQGNLTEVRNALEAKGDELSNRILILTEKNQQLEEQLTALKSDIESALKRNEALDALVKDYQNQLSSLQSEKNAVTSERDALKKSVDELSASLKAETSELKQQISQFTEQKSALEKKIAELDLETNAKIAAEEAEKQRIEQSYQQLLSTLKSEVSQKTIEIQNYQNALTINIMDQIFFNSGESRIKTDGMDVLRRLGEVLSSLPDKMIRVEGHTDDVPIGLSLRDKYPNNWMLGAARATAVAEYLRTKSGIDPTRIVVVSFSQYRPLVSNTTPEGRAKNRRIEILIVDKSLYENVEKK
jgi:chemotaxis protein MotB